MDSKIKNYNVIFHTRSVANEFNRKLLKKFTKLHFFTENSKKFHTHKKKIHKIISKIHKNRTFKKKQVHSWHNSIYFSIHFQKYSFYMNFT